MKKTTSVILCAVLMFLLAACNGGSFKRTKSGLMYKIISDEKNPVVKKGQIMKLEFTQKIRDSILPGSSESGPAYVMIDSAGPADYNPTEVFGLLRKGDSVVIVLEADTLIKRNPGGLPPFIKAKDKIYFMMRATNVFNTEEEANKDRDVAMQEFMKKQLVLSEEQKKKDIATLQSYAKSKNATVQSAPKGTLVEVVSAGDGPAVDSGMFVTVAYHGTNMEGVVFDSSKDPKFASPPYTFQIGSSPPGAIEGWDDGLRLFKKGGKGRLLVPSSLGYGKQGSPPRIKPNENLIFDVEVLDVSATRPAPPEPQPGPPPGQR
ncbi:MAG: FKBP-type peptidyl-prolyl cis-trans isomerase [Chitinophagaceae bacterium]|nr:FKBP-type peptidyl-prolyl cis-trans isomerase [Chitinophagaceae bacterium]